MNSSFILSTGNQPSESEDSEDKYILSLWHFIPNFEVDPKKSSLFPTWLHVCSMGIFTKW
jgi:hypothetical protein